MIPPFAESTVHQGFSARSAFLLVFIISSFLINFVSALILAWDWEAVIVLFFPFHYTKGCSGIARMGLRTEAFTRGTSLTWKRAKHESSGSSVARKCPIFSFRPPYRLGLEKERQRGRLA